MAKLIITEGGRDKIYEIVDDEFTIGSSSNADLHLRSTEVSPLHVTVRKTRGGYRLIDMETKVGTTVNGSTVNEHVLGNGDTIQLGDVKITYIGKGPARAPAASPAGSASADGTRGGAARRSSGPQSSRPFRREAAPSRSSAANFGIIAGIGVGVLVVVVLMLKTTDSENDIPSFELGEAVKKIDFQGASEASMENGRKILAKYEKVRDLDPAQKKRLRALKAKIEESKTVMVDHSLGQEAGKLWIKIHNIQLHEPNNIDGLKELCKAYLSKYPNGDKVVEVRAAAAKVENAGPMTPEQKELARVEGEVVANMKKKELRLAWEAIRSLDQGVGAIYPERVETLQRKVRMKSRQYLGVRKNEVRFYLREGAERDDGKARQYAETMIFDKLVIGTIEDYLDSPDKYRNPVNQRAEAETQKLLRQMLEERK